MIRSGLITLIASLLLIVCAPDNSDPSVNNYPSEVPENFEGAPHKHACSSPDPNSKLKVHIYSNKFRHDNDRVLLNAEGDWVVLIWNRNSEDKELMIINIVVKKDGLPHGNERHYLYVGGLWHSLKTATAEEMGELEKVFPRAKTEESALINGCLDNFISQERPKSENKIMI